MIRSFEAQKKIKNHQSANSKVLIFTNIKSKELQMKYGHLLLVLDLQKFLRIWKTAGETLRLLQAFLLHWIKTNQITLNLITLNHQMVTVNQ